MKKQASLARKNLGKKSAKGVQKSIEATIATVDQIKPATPKASRLISLLKTWLTDASGYDEETWPSLKEALDRERGRVGARRLFDG